MTEIIDIRNSEKEAFHRYLADSLYNDEKKIKDARKIAGILDKENINYISFEPDFYDSNKEKLIGYLYEGDRHIRLDPDYNPFVKEYAILHEACENSRDNHKDVHRRAMKYARKLDLQGALSVGDYVFYSAENRHGLDEVMDSGGRSTALAEGDLAGDGRWNRVQVVPNFRNMPAAKTTDYQTYTSIISNMLRNFGREILNVSKIDWPYWLIKGYVGNVRMTKDSKGNDVYAYDFDEPQHIEVARRNAPRRDPETPRQTANQQPSAN